MKYVHLMSSEVFMLPYIKFLEKNLKIEEHFFYIIGGSLDLNISKEKYILYYNNKKIPKYLKVLFIILLYIKMYPNLYKTKKIILHGLFNPFTILFLFFNPWFLKKCNWIIWGGDLYSYKKREYNILYKKIYYKIEDYVKGNLGYYSTVVEGDYRLAQEYFGAKGIYYKGFNYPSNLYKEMEILDIKDDILNIQIGNSADSSNNHLEILDKLEKFKNNKIKLFCILSYGDKTWAKKVIEYGKEKFGEKFIPILDFMEFHEYMKFISKIDIAIFAHDRQQGVGNIISLLSMRKTVYIKKDVTTYEMLKEKGIEILDFNELNNLEPLPIKVRKRNEEIIKIEFSKEKLKENLTKFFEIKN